MSIPDSKNSGECDKNHIEQKNVRPAGKDNFHGRPDFQPFITLARRRRCGGWRNRLPDVRLRR